MNTVNDNKRVYDLTSSPPSDNNIDKGYKRQCHEDDEQLARQLQQNELSKELMAPPKIKTSCNCSITITWIKVPNVKGYHVRYREQSDNEWIVIKQIISGTIVKKNNLKTKTPYVFCVRPLYDIMEGQWSLCSLHMYTSKPLTIATFNIGRSGLPSFFSNIQIHQKQYSMKTASEMVAELMNKHEIDILCLQELKGNVKEWKQFREGLQNSKISNQIIGVTQDTMLLNLKNMADFYFIAASDNKNKGLNGNVGMIIRKTLEVSEDQVSHCLQGFNDERTIDNIDNETNKYRKSNEGRYLEVALGPTVLINIYVHACASENQEVAQQQYAYRTRFLSAVEERIKLLKLQRKRVICVGDFNGTEVLTELIDCARLPIHRYTYYNQQINEKDEVVKAEKKSWHEEHWKGKKELWDGAYNRHNPSFGRGGYPCDYIKSTNDIEILSPSFKSANLRMYGCNLSCSIPCHNPDHALTASINSCKVKFPFEPAALIVYTSLDSDHMILKVNLNVPGV